jgi:predicted amidophosphoribosyltransferase
LCAREDRQFSAVWAIGSHSDRLRRALHEFKVEGNRAWAPVFARLVVGYLDDHLPWFDDYQLIVAAPSYVGPGARRDWDPVEEIIRAAAAEDGGMWPWDHGVPAALVRTADCGRISAQRGSDRRAFAEARLRPTLAVPEPDRIAGRRLLVLDDVFTEGSTMRELARALRLAGAIEVAGLVLARRPWLVEAA